MTTPPKPTRFAADAAPDWCELREVVVPNTPCRESRNVHHATGYGRKTVGHGRREWMHRWVVRTAGEDQHGTSWDESLVVMHECDNRACYRFDHLRLGTVADNNADMFSKDRHCKGDASPHARLTVVDVREIRSRRDAGESYTSIARDFPVNRQQISRIYRGERWAHVA